MIITPYKNEKSKNLYYRVKLNNKDLEVIKSKESLIYQLKCIGATQEIFNIKESLKTEDLSFNDRLFPTVPLNEIKRKKANFGLLLSHNQKKGYVVVINIEFKKSNIVFRDVYILNRVGETQKEFINPRSEYILGIELEKIYEKLIALPKQINLCNTCIYFNEYRANGYCLKYHPDSTIPSDY